MPARNQTLIRRDINRLRDTIDRHVDAYPALAAVAAVIREAADAVNRSWQSYQAATVIGDKERQERDTAVRAVVEWIQRWRPAMLMLVPGAEFNIRTLPASGATPDDVIRVAHDMAEFIRTNAGAESFRTAALEDIGDGIESARKETTEATAALPVEAAARQGYSDACLQANRVLISGTEIIRAIFGRTSPEYKQFIARSSAAEEAEIESESSLGEQ